MDNNASVLAISNAQQLGADMRTVIELPQGDYILAHKEFTLHDVTHLRDAPTRVKGVVTLDTYKDTAGYLNRFYETPEGNEDDVRSAVYFSESEKRVVVVLDHHAPGEPGWGEHKATYQARLSEPYKAWKGIAGAENFLPQEEFAEFIEDHVLDVVNPVAAIMLEIVETMHATLSGKFHRAVRRDNGTVSLTFDQTIDAKAGANGQLDVPRKLEISVPVFEGGPKYKVPLSLRYKIAGGTVLWGVVISGVQQLEQQAWGELVELFTKSISPDLRVPTFNGIPLVRK